jgi:Family of unknown function (DUF6263)
MKKTLLSALFLCNLLACNKENKLDDTNKKSDNTNAVIKTNEASKTNNESNSMAAALLPSEIAFTEKDGLFQQGLKLEVGKTYPFVTNSHVNKNSTGPDGKAITGTEIGLDKMDFTVNSYQNGMYEISLVMTAKSNSNAAMGKTISVDSQKPEPTDKNLQATWRVNKGMIGQVLQLSLSDKAQVKAIKGFDALYKSIEKSIGNLAKDKKELATVMQNIKAGFNEQMVSAQLKKSLAIIPSKGVKVGQTWSESINLSPDGKVKNTTNYKFLGLKNNAYEIEITGGLPAKTEKQTQKEMTMTMSLEVKQKGLVRFDAKTGWPLQSELEVINSQSQTISDGKKTESMSMKTSTLTQIN